MKKSKGTNKLFLFAISLSIIACQQQQKKVTSSDNNIDAARNFVRAALDGKFREAKDFMVKDSLNINYLDVVERAYQNIDPSEKDSYKGASIRIINTTEVSDSVSIIIYENSYKNDPDTLKILKQNGEWLVDLKYLYQHDATSTNK
jgi:lipopolysaccharide export LptBFGC system permease protein LptF